MLAAVTPVVAAVMTPVPAVVTPISAVLTPVMAIVPAVGTRVIHVGDVTRRYHDHRAGPVMAMRPVTLATAFVQHAETVVMAAAEGNHDIGFDGDYPAVA